MQRTRAKLSVLLLILTVIAACFLHFFSLYYQEIGVAIVSSATSTGLVYLPVVLGIIACVICSLISKPQAVTFDFSGESKGISLSSALLCVAFFYDFIHQIFNVYSYVTKYSYIDYAFVVPMGISGVVALICSFYFASISITARSNTYDFRNFTLLHFSPVLWAFTKLCGIMAQIVDIRLNTETCLEFILICVILMFLLNMILGIDNKQRFVTRAFLFSSLALVLMSFTVGLPRLILNIIMYDGTTVPSYFSPITYIMLGVFSLTVISDIKGRSKIQ